MRRLLIRPGAIGDVILSLPALEHLSATYTEVWTPSAVVPLIRFADRAVSLAATGIDMVGIGDLPLPSGFAQRIQSFDEIVSWYGSNRREFREALTALHPRCTFHAALPSEGSVHAVDFYAAQVGAPLGQSPKIEVNGDVARETVVVFPFSGGVRKNWPLESYAALAERLPFPVERADDRFESLLDLAEWITGARLYIGNDSGITHLAAAVGVPTLAIFTTTDPQVWAPRSSVVLQNPTVDDVVEAAIRRCTFDSRQPPEVR